MLNIVKHCIFGPKAWAFLFFLLFWYSMCVHLFYIYKRNPPPSTPLPPKQSLSTKFKNRNQVKIDKWLSVQLLFNVAVLIRVCISYKWFIGKSWLLARRKIPYYKLANSSTKVVCVLQSCFASKFKLSVNIYDKFHIKYEIYKFLCHPHSEIVIIFSELLQIFFYVLLKWAPVLFIML